VFALGAIALGAWLVGVHVAPAVADSITIAGVPCPVDRLATVGADKVTVRIGDKEALILRAELDDFVVRETFSSSDRAAGLSDRALVRFAESALSIRPTWTGLAVRIVRERALGDNADLIETVSAMREDSARTAALRDAAKVALIPVNQLAAQPRLTALLIFAIGLDEPEWLASHASEYLRAIEKPIKDLSIKEAHEALRLRDMERASRIGSFLAIAFGSTDQIARALAERIARVRGVLVARSAGDVAALVRAANPDPKDPTVSELIVPPALEGLHALATQAIETGKTDVGLEILSRINPLVRTESTHELTRVALERIGAAPNEALVRPEVLNFIDVIALNDPRVEGEYGRALAGQAVMRAEQGALPDAEALAVRLERLRGVDQSMKDEVFLRLARSYIARDEFDVAERKLNQVVRGGVSGWLMHVRLSVVQMSVGAFGLMIVLFIALGATLIGSLSRGRRRSPSPEFAEAEQAAATPGTPRPQRRTDPPITEAPLQEFVVADHRRMSPSAQEYQRCLETLGLSPSADVRAIKNAYRTLVKDVHPDRNRANDETASTRFIELTRVYDRVLELRREFGYDD